jgi:DNA-binding XRE family transcriptional regulator
MPKDLDAFYKEVGNLIQNKRISKKITQEKLASKVSLTRTSITNIEKGRQKLLLHTFFDIANSLDAKIEDLTPNDDSKKEGNIYDGLPDNAVSWIKSSVNDITKGN